MHYPKLSFSALRYTISSGGSRAEVRGGAQRVDRETRRTSPKGMGIGGGIALHQGGFGGPPPRKFLKVYPKMVTSGSIKQKLCTQTLGGHNF